jgi:hypothetical protein
LHTLNSIRDNASHSAACAQSFDNVFMFKHGMMCPTEPFIQFLHASFLGSGEERCSLWETAFRCCMQCCDRAFVGARAKHHGFTGRLLEELTLSYEHCFNR